MAGEKFYSDFKSGGYGKLQIDEPIGWGTSSFELKQKQGGYARDIFFGGGENEFHLSNRLNHHLDKMLYCLHHFGFESKENFIVEKNGVEYVMGEWDFATAMTDELEYFKCKVVQNGSLQIINRRLETKVDLMSNLNIDKEAIEPLVPQNILLLNKPTFETSEWKLETPQRFFERNVNSFYNLGFNINKSDIKDSFTPFETKQNYKTSGMTPIVTFKDNAKGIKINIKELKYQVYGNDNEKYASVALIYGKDHQTAKYEFLTNSGWTQSDIFDTLSGEFLIGDLKRGDSIWFGLLVSKAGNIDIKTNVDIEKSEFEVSATTYSYNSICPSFRLIDVMRQVVKSISGLEVLAPEFDYGGRFYDNRLYNGNFLRGIKDRGFKISLKDLEDSLKELNVDFEVMDDGRVFFGTEKEFYRNEECGFFDTRQFHSFNKTFNPRFTINEFSYIYKRYQSLKEKEELNSADVVHGEAKYTFFSKRVENKKEISIEWDRDAFIQDVNRRKAIELSESTSSQDDDNLSAIDSVDTLSDIPFNEVTELQHTFISETELSLKTKGDINFLALGINIGSPFEIKAPDNNAKKYKIKTISNSEIIIEVVSGGNVYANNDGIRITEYSYTISKDYVPFTNYTNQEVTAFNLNAPNDYSNLRYTIGRNIYNYWKEFLATCNLYWKEKPLVNTWYKNNPKCKTVYQGITIEEGGDIYTKDVKPILTPFIYNNIIFANVRFEDFMELVKKIRTKRGYIRCLNKLGRVIRIYPIDMKWDILNNQLTVKGEEKFESEYMTINTENNYVTINDEVRITYFKYEIKKEFVYIYDMNRKLLFNPVYWDMVSVNGAKSITSNELDKTLKLISKNEI